MNEAAQNHGPISLWPSGTAESRVSKSGWLPLNRGWPHGAAALTGSWGAGPRDFGIETERATPEFPIEKFMIGEDCAFLIELPPPQRSADPLLRRIRHSTPRVGRQSSATDATSGTLLHARKRGPPNSLCSPTSCQTTVECCVR